MSDENANDNNAPEDRKPGAADGTGADAPRDADTAPEAAADAELEAWERGPDAQIEALTGEVADLKDKLLRTMAEMENLRRRAEREREDARKYAVTNFARDMLAVGDNMQRALQSLGDEARADETVKTLIEGVEMTERELLNVFEKHGITKTEPKGEKFDPNFHQAMFEVENPEVPSGTVMDVVAAGYIIGDRVLRPAMVGVSKGGPKAAKPAETGEADAPPADAAAEAEAESVADAQAAAKSHQDTAGSKATGSAGKTVDKSA